MRARRVRRAVPEETPVAMVFDGATLAVMMASPADIRDFAYGFAVSEGVIAAKDEVESFEIAEHDAGIEARFFLREDRGEALAARRRLLAGPVGCGLCGIESLEAALRPLPVLSHPAESGAALSAADLAGAGEALRLWQRLHDLTRGVHAAGFLTAEEGIVMAREDVGRHNALDKLIGALLLAGISPARGAFVLTSRLSVELVQKSALAGCPSIVAVSAPTAHALRLAEEAGITVAAFARDGAFELFTHPGRITTGIPDVA
ncbi:MAG: formate dehydrogenase accessory sulfurtransferase FdhD [Paracoccus sp. (in: a-proteobacteria)]|nr:formate dehydrogenase accessory sulfurtransferase FdhD [Paracoccus sp. (in: a-proteobacteria)]